MDHNVLHWATISLQHGRSIGNHMSEDTLSSALFIAVVMAIHNNAKCVKIRRNINTLSCFYVLLTGYRGAHTLVRYDERFAPEQKIKTDNKFYN